MAFLAGSRSQANESVCQGGPKWAKIVLQTSGTWGNVGLDMPYLPTVKCGRKGV